MRAALDGLGNAAGADARADARVIVTVAVAVLPPGGAVTVEADALRPLDPLDAVILRVVRAIVRRTSRPARTDSITVQVNCETELELTENAVRRRLLDLEARGHLYRVSPRTGWLTA